MFGLEQLVNWNEISMLGFALAFAAGLIVAFSPSSIPMIPVLMGYVLKPRGCTKGRSIILSSGFVFGIVFINVLLGLIFTSVGAAAGKVFGPSWNIVISLLLLIMGLQVLGVLRIRLPQFNFSGNEVTSFFGAFLLGIPFVLSLCPYCVPIQLTMLTAAAATQQVWYGGLLLLFFGLGRGLPLFLVGQFSGFLAKAGFMTRHNIKLQKASGLVFIGMSGLYLYQFLNVVKYI